VNLFNYCFYHEFLEFQAEVVAHQKLSQKAIGMLKMLPKMLSDPCKVFLGHIWKALGKKTDRAASFLWEMFLFNERSISYKTFRKLNKPVSKFKTKGHMLARLCDGSWDNQQYKNVKAAIVEMFQSMLNQGLLSTFKMPSKKVHINENALQSDYNVLHSIIRDIASVPLMHDVDEDD